MEKPYLIAKSLCKYYPGVKALDGASIEFYAGEVHALLGENGAGKSTLCKLLSGAITPDGGGIEIDGRSYPSFDPISSQKAGIGMIYQELNLVPALSVYENFFLGKEICKGPNIDKKAMIRETRDAMSRFGVSIDPRTRVGSLSIAYQQMVEICKTVYDKAKIIIMDEPTAPLTNQEVEVLFHLIRDLKAQGIVIIYISHRIEELYELSEKVTVMRDGMVIETLDTAQTTRPQLISLMVGRELGEDFPQKQPVPSDPILEVKSLTTAKVKNVSFTLNRGEVLGFGGLVGSGRTEIARAVFGADEVLSGEILLNGRPVTIRSTADAIKNRMALISEDRKSEGIHLKLSVKENISLVVLDSITKFLTVDNKKDAELANRYVADLKIKTPGINQITNNLSGGNQQKVILSKWLASNADILILDEPTRGIDVATKQEIYDLMDRLRQSGKAIIMISSELPELIGMSNRIMVMYEGELQGELCGDDTTQEDVLKLASGAE